MINRMSSILCVVLVTAFSGLAFAANTSQVFNCSTPIPGTKDVSTLQLHLGNDLNSSITISSYNLQCKPEPVGQPGSTMIFCGVPSGTAQQLANERSAVVAYFNSVTQKLSVNVISLAGAKNSVSISNNTQTTYTCTLAHSH